MLEGAPIGEAEVVQAIALLKSDQPLIICVVPDIFE
jgi:hypothetical protein